ncbi:MAG: ArsR family transcriptional regulator [Methanobacteriota archaeon]|nr:MAG: ArsR family transcriptional regulator [Euryarchaeota archaeon]
MTACTQYPLAEEMAGVFKALGDINRLRIVHCLANDASGTLGVGDLARLLGISQPAVSQHIRTLKSVQIVEARKKGNHVYFSFNREAMSRYRDQFMVLYQCMMEKCDQENGKRAKREESA